MTERELMETILKKITRIETQQQEDHVILKALEQNLGVNKAEHYNIFNVISHIKSNLKKSDENIVTVKGILEMDEVDKTL